MYQQSIYAIGTHVLVRRFSSKCRKRAGNKSASKATRIVKGTVSDRNVRNGTYKIRFCLMDQEMEEWFKVSDWTSLTLEENKKHMAGVDQWTIIQHSATAQPLHSSWK
jgi:hypothetical protein